MKRGKCNGVVGQGMKVVQGSLRGSRQGLGLAEGRRGLRRAQPVTVCLGRNRTTAGRPMEPRRKTVICQGTWKGDRTEERRRVNLLLMGIGCRGDEH